jgi:hypothetical protein
MTSFKNWADEGVPDEGVPDGQDWLPIYRREDSRTARFSRGPHVTDLVPLEILTHTKPECWNRPALIPGSEKRATRLYETTSMCVPLRDVSL